MIRTGLAASLLGLVCVSAQADTLADLTAKLKTLSMPTPVRGVLDVDYDQFDEKGVADKVKSAHVQMDVDTAAGLSIQLSPAAVSALTAEEARNSADPDAPTPQADLLRDMSPIRIQHILSAADTLLRLMDGATSPVAKSVTLDGTTVTALSMNVPFRAPKKDSDAAKDWQDTLTIWIDTQGVPLRFEDKVHAKFCKFLFCVTVDESNNAALRVLEGRLVMMSDTLEHQQSGMGQDSHTRTAVSLQLK